MTTTFDAALSELNRMIPNEVFADFSEFDGTSTILVPNETITYDLTKGYEGPQIIEFGPDQLQTFPTRIRWDLRATSTSLRITDAITMDNRPDWNMVLVGERICEVYVGDRWMRDFEFFALILKNAQAKTGKDARSVESIVTSLKQRGLDFTGAMPMYIQHLGADIDRFNDEVVPFFERCGASDNTAAVQQGAAQRSRTVKSLRLDGSGVRVVNFEVGTSDRRRSQNGTGFISFLDATYTTVRAIVEADRTIAIADHILRDPNADEQDKALAQSRRDSAISYWNSGTQRSRRPFHNWGGTSRVPSGEGLVQYFPTPVPSGRVTLEAPNGEQILINVWQSARMLPNQTTSLPSVLADPLQDYAAALQTQYPTTTPPARGGVEPIGPVTVGEWTNPHKDAPVHGEGDTSKIHDASQYSDSVPPQQEPF